MSEIVRNERFLSWSEACRYVGEKGVLNEIKEVYFRYAGFASLEMGEKSYDRVHVNGFLRIYPTDLNDLRGGLPVACNSAIVNHFMAINGTYNDDQREKFIVFDDEVMITGGQREKLGDGEIPYPNGIFFHEQDLLSACQRFGLKPGKFEDAPSQHRLNPERELDLLCLVGAMSCLLAQQKGVDCTLEWHHLTDAFLDELFDILEGLGIVIDGKNKFEFERLIAEGVKYVNHRPDMAREG
jgi:hypothetical protein